MDTLGIHETNIERLSCLLMGDTQTQEEPLEGGSVFDRSNPGPMPHIPHFLLARELIDRVVVILTQGDTQAKNRAMAAAIRILGETRPGAKRQDHLFDYLAWKEKSTWRALVEACFTATLETMQERNTEEIELALMMPRTDDIERWDAGMAYLKACALNMVGERQGDNTSEHSRRM